METQHPLKAPEASALLFSAMEEGRDAAVLVLLHHLDPKRLGERVLIVGGERHGSFQDAATDEAAMELASRALKGEPGIESGSYSLPLSGGGEIRVFLELHRPQPEMIIVGAGHVAQPLCTLGHLLGLRVRVLDDRPEFATRERFPEADEVCTVDFSDPFDRVPLHPWSHVVLVTRGHRYDYECLRHVLLRDRLPAYIGMIGSRRRVRATFEALLNEGISQSDLQRVRAPIGMDLGAETPAEIAIAVAAEIVQLHRGGTGRPLQEVEGILGRFFQGDA